MRALLSRSCLFALITLIGSCSFAPALRAQAPPDAGWNANAELAKITTQTMTGLGAIQGASFRDGNLYLFGDVWNLTPRVGVIREYTSNYEPTGRVVWLRRLGKTVIRHPTGLTWHSRWGTILGDTVNRKAVIYHLDWQKALEDGNLDHAVLDVLDDDAAVNGCRPEFVTLDGHDYLATADYGDVRPEVRLYDPELLLRQRRSSAPGVVVHRILCGPFNQSLHWDATPGELTCIQNVIPGRGWQLEVFNLAKAVADGRSFGPGVRMRLLTFAPHNELEGYRPLDDGRGLFVTSSLKDNLTVAEIKEGTPKESRPANRPLTKPKSP
jgi:hypothetical protein